ncbi:MAG TPA: F0F1 ATP synthase subunit delta [Jatrophihabitans sp.]|jgi:F-type H+-transporting ATPase subunit delta
MQAASREALSNLRSEVSSVLGRFSTAEGLAGLADELYAVGDLLTAQPRLRRRLADPAAQREQRTGLVEALLGGKISASAMSVVNAAVAARWSSAWDLVDGIETSGDDVLLAAAESDGALDSVEDELFRLERILDAESNLTTILDEASADARRRADLVESLLAGKAHPAMIALVRHAVSTQRKRSVLLALDDLIAAAGARRDRSVARVVSAVEMTDKQQGDLAARLSEMYGRRIEVRYAVDPSIRGGLVVRVGDEVIDGSIASRLTQVRRAFAG